MPEELEVKTFKEYISWLKRLYEEDPLLAIALRIHKPVPLDNELLVLSASPDELEKMLSEMEFRQAREPRLETYSPPYANGKLKFLNRAYVLEEGFPLVQFEALENPQKAVFVKNPKENKVYFRGSHSFGLLKELGEMKVHTQLMLHPYTSIGLERKQIPKEQLSAMVEFYKQNAERKIGNKKIGELLRGIYHLGDDYRAFADKVSDIMKYLSEQSVQAAFLHYKNPYIIAVHNVNLKQHV